MLPVLEVGAREGRGKGVLEIGFGADLGQGPLGKLAAQEEAEALAEHQAAGALAEFHAGAAAEIEEEHLAFAAGEAFHRHGEARVGGLGDGGEAAAPVARAVPGLKGESRAAHFERVVFAVEGSNSSPGSRRAGSRALLREVLDLGADLRQVAGDGGLHSASTASM